MSYSFTGRCLCGGLSFECRAQPAVAGHCYCTDCRRASGTGHSSHLGAPRAAVTISGEARRYESKADSGNTVTRAFCPTCGGQVYSLNSAMPEMIFLRASSLDDPAVFRPAFAIYTSRAPSWDPVAPGLASFPAMPPPEAMPGGGRG